MITQPDLIEFCDRFFQVEQYPLEERGGIYRFGDRPIHRLGLALEPFPDLNLWIAKHRIDALFLPSPVAA